MTMVAIIVMSMKMMIMVRWNRGGDDGDDSGGMVTVMIVAVEW